MASDEIVWAIIDKQFCSFKLKTTKGQNFCHNEYNVTGLCSRQACPLANSRYATVRADAETGRLYLYMKTIERAHLPSRMWEKIKLSANYSEALKQIDDRLIYWPKFLIHKCKQRLTRLTQVAIRMRRIAKEEARLGERLVPKLSSKIKRREETRERKALGRAQIEKTVERELLERLRSGVYGDNPLNVSETIWKRVLKAMEKEGAVRDKDMDKGIEEEEEGVGEFESEAEEELEEEEEEEDDAEAEIQYVSDFDESEDEVGDIEDWLGDDQSSDEEQSSASGDSDEEGAPKKKMSAGDKRKRGRVVRMKPKKKMAVREVEAEAEYEKPAAQALAF